MIPDPTGSGPAKLAKTVHFCFILQVYILICKQAVFRFKILIEVQWRQFSSVDKGSKSIFHFRTDFSFSEHIL